MSRDAEQIKELQAEVDGLRSEIECLQSKSNHLGQELQAEQEKSKRIDQQWRAQHELLTSSRSWRWTAPLRFVTGTLGVDKDGIWRTLVFARFIVVRLGVGLP